MGERIQQEQRAEKPLLLLLDEAANSAPLTKLPQYVATLRSRDVQLVTIFQDYGQVVRRWGRDNARSVLNNHVARVLLPGMADPDLLEIFSTLVGERQAVSTSVSQGPSGPSSSETHKWERLAPINELRTLPAGHAVLLHDNTPPAKVRLRPYYSSGNGPISEAGSASPVGALRRVRSPGFANARQRERSHRDSMGVHLPLVGGHET